MSMLQISAWLRRGKAIFVAVVVVAGLALWYFTTRLPPIPQRPLRIGFEPNPPVQIRTDSGFTGLAVETINEAAKRACVQLKWVETGTSSDEAFQKGLVDLWPLMADLSDRRKRVHITQPWLHSSHVLLLDSESASLDSGFAGRIALFKMPVHARLLRKQFTGAQLVELTDAKDVVSAVCGGTVAAAFLESRVALGVLHDKPANCASVALRVQILPDLTLQHGVASTFEAARAAEVLRREIGNMFRDGTLALTIAKYSYYGLDDTWASYDLMQAAERAERMAWGIGLLAIAITVPLWRILSLRQRNRAKAALRESEERFRTTFYQAAVGIAQASVEGEWLLLNDRFCELLGYTQAELRGKMFLDFTHPDDCEASLDAKRRLLAGEISSWLGEKRYFHKNGAIVWVRLSMSMVRDQDNRPQYLIAMVEDVTERVQAERALRDSEERLALAQNAAQLGVWDWDLLTNAHWGSGEYLRLYGLPSDGPSITYQEWLSLIHPDDRERVQAFVRESLERTHAWDTEFRVLWPDGSTRWLLGKGTVFVDDSGRPVRMTGVNLDITERKRAESALRASELQYKEVFDNISICMFVVDVTSDGRFKFTGFNPSEEKAVGLSNAEVSGRFVEEVFAEDLAQKLTANCRRCLEAGAPIEYEDELNLPGGRRYFHSNLIPMRDDVGRIHRIVGACMDMTEQKFAEGTLRRSLDEIAHLNRVAALGELTASMAHELNQPLAAILSNAQAASRFLAGEPPDLAQVRECLTDIVADDKRAGHVIQGLRRLLKKGEFQPSSIDLNEVVSDAIQLVKNDTLLRNTSVRFEPFSGLPLVRGDRIQLYQVALNLIMNSLDATAEQPSADRWVSVRTAELEGGGVQLTVEDSGKGVPETNLTRVFEPFFSTKREGLGMGLSITRSIVQAHGGRIWAENSARRGAIFHCILPLAQQAAAASANET